MKKVIGFICITIMLFSMSITALAGSIPEDLLNSDDTQIFFAEVVSYNGDKENPKLEISPVKKVKGDVKIGEKLMAYKPNPFRSNIEVGNVYLFTYFDENNTTDIFEVTSYDTSKLKLKNVEGDMWERFEKYLNEGRYEEAEQERIERLGLLDEPMGEADTLPPIEDDFELPFLETPLAKKIFYISFFAVAIFAVAFVIGFAVKKRRGASK